MPIPPPPPPRRPNAPQKPRSRVPAFVAGGAVGIAITALAAIAVALLFRHDPQPAERPLAAPAAVAPPEPITNQPPVVKPTAAGNQPPQSTNRPATPAPTPPPLTYSAKDQTVIDTARAFIDGYRSKPLTAKAVGVQYEVGGDEARVAFDDMNEYEAYLRYDALRKRWNVRYFTFTVGNQVIRYPP